MTEVFVYIFDLFIPTDLTKKEVMKEFERDILKPFELVRDVIKDKLRGIKNVELYNAFFKDDEFVLEYAVDFANGRINVRIIGSENPSQIAKLRIFCPSYFILSLDLPEILYLFSHLSSGS